MAGDWGTSPPPPWGGTTEAAITAGLAPGTALDAQDTEPGCYSIVHRKTPEVRD